MFWSDATGAGRAARTAAPKASATFTLTGAHVLTSQGLQDVNVAVEDGGIVEIGAPVRAQGPVLRADGWLALPGIVDLHGDAFERQLMPRPQVRFPVAMAMHDTDRQLASNGITTAFHGVTWSWEGGLRGGASARDVMNAIHARKHAHGIDHRVHLRFEAHNVAEASEVGAAIDAGLVDFLAFNDHLGEIARKCEANPQKRLAYAERAETTSDEFMARLDAARLREAEVEPTVRALAARARQRRIGMASHDDLTVEDRERHAALGAEVAEFPRSLAAVEAARRLGSAIALGAPNVVRGGSHVGAVNAAEMALAGQCDVLTSDYFYPSLLLAPFLLAYRHGMDFAQAWRLVSRGPAHAARLSDRGEIAPGRRADIVLVDDSDVDAPRVIACFVAGRAVYLAHGLIQEQLA